ncbi:papilin [Culex quinquefasciatus]|uniref:Papilin n=1 Tax=Culex quinquefasciatus TaxID=7176 RepID=B0W7X9_CULQU|nr:papilin [Culex quinquefasciatus]|eukprot:XP_001844813.1 papilin [Culex quinquefasciatus]
MADHDYSLFLERKLSRHDNTTASTGLTNSQYAGTGRTNGLATAPTSPANSCSASCLTINCTREDTGKIVSPFLCSPDTKPEARIRNCNDIPCPPRWNYSKFTRCSKFLCIYEVTRDGENTMIVPNSMCTTKPYPEPQFCNINDCPLRGRPCGDGLKERCVECKQIMTQEHKVERPASMYPSSKPPDKKPCNGKACILEYQNPPIAGTNSTFIQYDPEKNKITLKFGGAATVFFGKQIKIKCPFKRFNRIKIQWAKVADARSGITRTLRHVVAREFGKHLHRSDCWRRFWGLVPGGRSSSGGHSAQVDSRGKGRRSTSRTSGGTRIRSRDVPARCAMLEISQIDDPSTLHRSQHLYPGGPAADVTEHEKDLYNHYQKHSFRGAGHKYFGNSCANIRTEIRPPEHEREEAVFLIPPGVEGSVLLLLLYHKHASHTSSNKDAPGSVLRAEPENHFSSAHLPCQSFDPTDSRCVVIATTLIALRFLRAHRTSRAKWPLQNRLGHTVDRRTHGMPRSLIRARPFTQRGRRPSPKRVVDYLPPPPLLLQRSSRFPKVQPAPINSALPRGEQFALTDKCPTSPSPNLKKGATSLNDDKLLRGCSSICVHAVIDMLLPAPRRDRARSMLL